MCSLLLYSTLFWELSQRFFSFVPLHKWTVQVLLLLPKNLSKVLSAVYFPLYYIAGENGFKFEYFNTFFKPFTICRKNRVLGGVFWKVCAPLPRFCYYAQNILRVFVQEFFCPFTTIFHTFLRIESNFFKFCSFAQMNDPPFVVIAKGFVEGVISD